MFREIGLFLGNRPFIVREVEPMPLARKSQRHVYRESYSAASFAAACSAWITATLRSTSSMMCSTIPSADIV